MLGSEVVMELDFSVKEDGEERAAHTEHTQNTHLEHTHLVPVISLILP